LNEQVSSVIMRTVIVLCAHFIYSAWINKCIFCYENCYLMKYAVLNDEISQIKISLITFI
jgi:hypothetical protein